MTALPRHLLDRLAKQPPRQAPLDPLAEIIFEGDGSSEPVAEPSSQGIGGVVLWTKRVTTRISRWQVPCQVQASILGKLAIFQSVVGRWLVGPLNVSNKCLLNNLGSEDEARRAAEFCWANFADAFRLTNQDAMADALPDWFRAWVKACNRTGKLADPLAFKKGAK